MSQTRPKSWPWLTALVFSVLATRAALALPDASHSLAPVESRILEDDEYQPIIPPDTIGGFLNEIRSSSNYLASLPIDRELTIDILEKVLNALVINLGDELHRILAAFGIDFDIDFSRFTFRYLLNLLHFYSYNQDLAGQVMEQWEQGLPPELEESVRRFYLAQKLAQESFNAGMKLTDDAALGAYDLLDLVLSSNKIIDRISDELDDNPLIGRIVRLIKIKITQRIVYAFQNAVLLVTSYLPEPRRSQIRAVATALATTYIKWKDLRLGDGFGGIGADTVTKVGVAVMSKTVLLMAPRIGHVKRTEDLTNKGAIMARDNEVTGTWDEARTRILDDESEETEDAIIEHLAKDTARTMRLTRQERRAANIAGAVAQILQLVTILDPSSITRIVGISFRILAGGLQAHSIYASTSRFFKIKGVMRRGLHLAFHPDQVLPEDGEPGDTVRLVQGDRERSRLRRTNLVRARASFGAAVETMAALAMKKTTLEANDDDFVQTLEELDQASNEYTRRLISLNGYNRPFVAGVETEELVDPLSLALIQHDMTMASVYGTALEFAMNPGKSTLRRQFLDELEKAEVTVVQGVESGLSILEEQMMQAGAGLEMKAPGSVQLASSIKVPVVLINTGTEVVRGVQVQINVPAGYRSLTAYQRTVAELLPGEEIRLSWGLAGSPDHFSRGSISVVAQHDSGLWASAFVYVSR